METIDAENKHYFTLLWDVENADLLDSKHELMKVSSPRFKIVALKGRIFQLELSVKQDKGRKKSLSLTLHLLDRSFGFPVDIEWSFLGSDGKPVSIGKEVNHYPLINDVFKMSDFLMFEEVFYRRRFEFFCHKALTIRLRIWKSHGDLANNEFISCQSRLETVKYSFLWNIPNFSRLPLSEELTSPVTFEVHDDLENFVLTFSLEGTTLLESNAVMQISPLLIPRTWNITTVVSILDSKGEVIAFVEDQPNFNEEPGRSWNLPELMPRKELLRKELPFLMNDVLTLLCEVSVIQSSFAIRENCFNLPNPIGRNVPVFLDSSSQISELSDYSEDIFPQQSDSWDLSGPSTFKDEIRHTSEQASDTTPIITFPENESLRTFAEDILSLYRNETLTDFELRSGNDSFRVHKNILSARSVFFREMFTSNSQDSGSNVFNIQDLDTQTLSETLTFLYSGKLENLNLERVLKLRDAAEKYKVQSLKEECYSFLRSHISKTNFYDLLVLLSERHHDLDLKNLIYDFLFSHFDETLKSREWVKFMGTAPQLAGKLTHEIYLEKRSSTEANDSKF